MIINQEKFAFFEGEWVFDRFITGSFAMKGFASFLPFQDVTPSYSYREDGEFTTPHGDHFPFYRDYIYCLNPDSIDVYFASHQKKQGHFYRLNFSSDNKASGSHLCRDDFYKATYTFLNENNFSLQFEVKGPRKDFLIETTFKRLQSI